MLMVFPTELVGKITYVDGKLTATEKLTDEEQALFDDLVKKEKETEDDMFEEE